MVIAKYKHKDGRIFELNTNHFKKSFWWNYGTPTDMESIKWLVSKGILKKI